MRNLAIITFFTALLCGACSNQEEYLISRLRLDTLEKLERDQKAVIKHLIQRIENKKVDPPTAKRTSYWSPLIDSVVQYMSTLNAWFELVEGKLGKTKDYKLEEKEIEFLVKKIESHNSDFKKILGLMKSNELYATSTIQELENVIQSTFLKSYKLDSIDQTNKEKYIEEKIRYMLKGSVSLEIQSNIKCLKAEFNFTVAQILQQIDMQTEVIVSNYEFVRCIIASNVSALRAGQDLEIVAGIGEFSAAAKPRFFVSGIEIKPQENEPILLYKKKINESPGTHSIPITIDYVKPDGTSERITKSVIYQVLPD